MELQSPIIKNTPPEKTIPNQKQQQLTIKVKSGDKWPTHHKTNPKTNHAKQNIKQIKQPSRKIILNTEK